jgi:hypothetical protein
VRKELSLKKKYSERDLESAFTDERERVIDRESSKTIFLTIFSGRATVR